MISHKICAFVSLEGREKLKHKWFLEIFLRHKGRTLKRWPKLLKVHSISILFLARAQYAPIIQKGGYQGIREGKANRRTIRHNN